MNTFLFFEDNPKTPVSILLNTSCRNGSNIMFSSGNANLFEYFYDIYKKQNIAGNRFYIFYDYSLLNSNIERKFESFVDRLYNEVISESSYSHNCLLVPIISIEYIVLSALKKYGYLTDENSSNIFFVDNLLGLNMNNIEKMKKLSNFRSSTSLKGKPCITLEHVSKVILNELLDTKFANHMTVNNDVVCVARDSFYSVDSINSYEIAERIYSSLPVFGVKDDMHRLWLNIFGVYLTVVSRTDINSATIEFYRPVFEYYNFTSKFELFKKRLFRVNH